MTPCNVGISTGRRLLQPGGVVEIAEKAAAKRTTAKKVARDAKKLGVPASKNALHLQQYFAPQKSPVPLGSFSTRHAPPIALYIRRRLIQLDRRRAFYRAKRAACS
ncbi:hypothetical protein [Caballeronia novacaledonica]|uniref:hypothetical protein n=1 Tax=Caballeronia novacaledonica TaxID=1544861 RepID=UPI0011B1E761|nr:hypothetical protein [Caballeronia novacaledonica]